MYFTDEDAEDAEVLYILVSIKINIVNVMDIGHYICDVIDYSTGTWWNCDDDTITKYSVYPNNVYDNVSKDNEQKKGFFWSWMDQIGSCQCYILKNTFFHPTLTILYRKIVSRDIEHIKERITDFIAFKEEVGINEMICSNIQTIILLWNEDFKTTIGNNERNCSSEKNLIIG